MENYNWTKYRDQWTLRSSATTHTTTSQLLHIWLREHWDMSQNAKRVTVKQTPRNGYVNKLGTITIISMDMIMWKGKCLWGPTPKQRAIGN